MGNTPLLLLRLEGPLQSWGLRSRWDVRDTGDEPSKSGIIGMMGCALGLSRRDSRLEQLDQQLTLGVRVERPGRSLIDYQTITGELATAEGGVKGSVENPSTIVSPRAYLQDAAFLAVLGGPPSVLERCQQALADPYWPIYLGRKSCPPTRPVYAGLVTGYESVADALFRYPWDWAGRGEDDIQPERLRCVLEIVGGQIPKALQEEVGSQGLRSYRTDRTQSNLTRMYGSRMVLEFGVPFPGMMPLDQEEGGGTACSSRG